MWKRQLPWQPWPLLRKTTASTCSVCSCRPGRRAYRRARSPLDLAPNTLTFHFDRLRQAGLVTVRREGRSMIYAARFETMNALLGFLTENCCGGAPEKCAPAAACKPAQGKRAKAAVS
jgi:DNA-binding transcriptional ArsR family regulator